MEPKSRSSPAPQSSVNRRCARSGGEVYLVNGDSHIYNTDRPLATGSSWLTTYDVTGAADNLQRITVDGSSNNKDWLSVTINEPGSQHVLSWQRVPYRVQAG